MNMGFQTPGSLLLRWTLTVSIPITRVRLPPMAVLSELTVMSFCRAVETPTTATTDLTSTWLRNTLSRQCLEGYKTWSWPHAQLLIIAIASVGNLQQQQPASDQYAAVLTCRVLCLAAASMTRESILASH